MIIMIMMIMTELENHVWQGREQAKHVPPSAGFLERITLKKDENMPNTGVNTTI
jgi:hypothetical protein